MEGPSYQYLSIFDKGSFHFPREESSNILAASALGSEWLRGRVSHSLYPLCLSLSAVPGVPGSGE